MPKRPTNHITDGQEAEQLAMRYLIDQGLTVVGQNFRVRGGELDLICRDGPIWVFVEVRLRRHPGFGGALESITAAKRQRILLAAQHYIARHRLTGPCRFDCVLLEALSSHSLHWIRDAFAADD